MSGDLADRAYGVLELRICDYRYSPGARLSADLLSAELGLGRTPVRAALEWLHRDGIIDHEARTGFSVKAPDVADYRDLYSCSRALAIGAFPLPATSFEGLPALPVKMRSITGPAYESATAALLSAIVARLGSRTALEALRRINSRLRFVRRLELSVLRGADAELARLLSVAAAAPGAALKRALDVYHQRRLRALDQLVDAACARALRARH